MAAEELIHCVYCGEQRPSSREHVLQRALGGNFTTRVVCTDCNGGFSSIDQALAEDSLVALTRVGLTPREAFSARLGGDHFTPDTGTGIWMDSRVTNRMHTEVLPQIHLRGPHLSVTGSDHEGIARLVVMIDRRIASGTLSNTHFKIGPAERCSTARIVTHRKNDLYVRATSEEAAKQLLHVLSANWEAFKTQFEAPAETSMRTATQVNLSVNVCLDDNYRAVAKTVFNFMAVRLGAEFARRNEFAEIRDYIRGITIVHMSPLPEGDLVVDTRFVRQLAPGEQPIIPTGMHLVALAYSASRLYGSLTLYGRDTFVVELGQVELDRHVLEAHEFSIDRTANRSLNALEIAKRLAGASSTR